MCIRSCRKTDRAPPQFLLENIQHHLAFLHSLTVPGPVPFIHWISVLAIMEAQYNMWALP
ncbi:unnamed protein product, partial [Staurois parvus]